MSYLIKDEVPFTTEAVKMYIIETEKRLEYLKIYVSEYNRLKNRLKFAKERLKKRNL